MVVRAPQVVEEVLQHVEHVRGHVVEADRRVAAALRPVRLGWRRYNYDKFAFTRRKNYNVVVKAF